MQVPAGVGRLGVDMRTPNPNNDAVLALLLFDPKGRISQISYDYSITPDGPVSNNENVQVANPMPGKWTAQIVWNNGRGHLQDPPIVPGSYRGNIVVRFTGQSYTSKPATGAVTIPAHSSRTVAVPVTQPNSPGDSATSLKFSGGSGPSTIVPVVQRTLIPSQGGTFRTVLGSSVARYQGPLHNFQTEVPAGKKDLRFELATPDASPNNIIDYFLVEPDGVSIYADSTPSVTTEYSREAGHASIVVSRPDAGLWTLQVFVVNTESGKEFDQTVTGSLAYNTSRVQAYNVPDSAAATFAKGSKTTLRVAVTNTLNVGRTFELAGDNGDIAGNGVYIPAGATALVTATLSPTAKAGTVVKGQLYVLTSTVYRYIDFNGNIASAPSTQALTQLPYEYTVSASA